VLLPRSVLGKSILVVGTGVLGFSACSEPHMMVRFQNPPHAASRSAIACGQPLKSSCLRALSSREVGIVTTSNQWARLVGLPVGQAIREVEAAGHPVRVLTQDSQAISLELMPNRVDLVVRNGVVTSVFGG
jgi:hypothetical protein